MATQRQSVSTKRPCHGFTLIESMMALALLAVLIGVAAPSFREVIRNNRTTAVTNDLVAALHYARSEAVRQGLGVRLCAGDDFDECDGDWLSGWYVTTDPSDPDAVLRAWPGPPDGAQIDQGDTITFAPLGATDGTVTFEIEYTGCTDTGARRVQVSPMGRIRTEAVPCAN